MDIDVYYFIKYFSEGYQAYINKISLCNATLCFDLEDSIQDIFDETATADLKATYRHILHSILSSPDIKISRPIGVRVNPLDSEEFLLDIEMLERVATKRTIQAIMVPKVECAEDVLQINELLALHHIRYNELIIFIESEQGVINLEAILSLSLPNFNKIIFGHADLNHSIQSYPFFHQDNQQYWQWAKQIINIAESKGFMFINSPCFYLDNKVLFDKMLNELKSISTKRFGQMALTYKQALWCSQFDPVTPAANDTQLSGLEVDIKAYSEYLVTMTESYNHQKGLTINGENVLITPQEYKVAKEYLKSIAVS